MKELSDIKQGVAAYSILVHIYNTINLYFKKVKWDVAGPRFFPAACSARQYGFRKGGGPGEEKLKGHCPLGFFSPAAIHSPRPAYSTLTPFSFTKFW